MATLLKPMPPDALLRKPEPKPQAQPKAQLVSREDSAPSPLMKPPVLAARPSRLSEPQLDDLLAPFLPQDEEDEDGEDCVPTSRMPQPACVPLYEEPRRRRAWRRR